MSADYDMSAAVAEIYEGLSDPRAALARANVDAIAPEDIHETCTDSDALGKILNAVPDSRASVKHTDDCWQTHAACMRDKIYKDLGWE